MKRTKAWITVAALTMAGGVSVANAQTGDPTIDLTIIEMKSAIREAIREGKSGIDPRRAEQLSAAKTAEVIGKAHAMREAAWQRNPYAWVPKFDCPLNPPHPPGLFGIFKSPKPCIGHWLRTPIDIDGNPTGPSELLPWEAHNL